MSYFLFNGISSRELGMIVTSPVIRPSWAIEESEYTLAGRTTKYSQKSKTYNNADMFQSTPSVRGRKQLFTLKILHTIRFDCKTAYLNFSSC